jgi:cyanophycin synthetase
MDMAHNEAGLEALLEVARGLTAPGGAVRLGLGCAGDRSDDAIVSMGEIAGRRADETVIKLAVHYLRGRQPDELTGLFREGLAHEGVLDVPLYSTELEALQALVPHAHPGDVVALMCHAERTEVAAWIRSSGGKVDDARAIRRKVVAARGEHEFEAEIAAVRELVDDDERVRAAGSLVVAHPSDPRLLHELASELHRVGQDTEAIVRYREALGAGLKEPYRHRAQLQLAASLRVVGRPNEALTLLDDVLLQHPGNTAATMLLALVRTDLGEDRQAVADLIRAVLEGTTDPETQAYRHELRRFADDLAPALGAAAEA